MSCFRFGPDQTKHLPGTNEKQVSTITFQTGAKSCYKLLCELKKYHLEEQSADVVYKRTLPALYFSFCNTNWAPEKQKENFRI